MSNNSSGFFRFKEKLPYQGKGIDSLVEFLRRTFSQPENKYIQKVICEVGVPYVRIEKMVPEDQRSETQVVSLHDQVRSKVMEELKVDGESLTSMHQLWAAFDLVQTEGYQVSYVLVGNKQHFQNWLKVRIPVTRMTVFGVPLVIINEYPHDVFVVCGSMSREADVEDIEFSVKGTCL